MRWLLLLAGAFALVSVTAAAVVVIPVLNERNKGGYEVVHPTGMTVSGEVWLDDDESLTAWVRPATPGQLIGHCENGKPIVDRVEGAERGEAWELKPFCLGSVLVTEVVYQKGSGDGKVIRSASDVRLPVRPADFARLLVFSVNGSTVVSGRDEIDVFPYVNEDEVILVPVRWIAEVVGGKIQWNRSRTAAKLVWNDTEVIVTVGSDTAEVNGAPLQLSGRVSVLDGQIMVPGPEIVQALGGKAKYDDFSSTLVAELPEAECPPVYCWDRRHD